jgi:hypothetical protein
MRWPGGARHAPRGGQPELGSADGSPDVAPEAAAARAAETLAALKP